MSEEEDFNIVPDDETETRRSTWVWVGIIVVVALFAFGVGIAFMILSNRMGPSTPTATPNLVVIAPTPAHDITGTATITTGAPITASLTPTATPTTTPTATPSPTVTPSCTQQVEQQFVQLYDQAQFGCATAGSGIVWAAYQPFERGSMLWRSDSNTSYVFYNAGNWFPIELGWDGGPSADRGAPPPGLQMPQRGFGYVWSHNDDLFNGLGWARDQEKGFCALVQQFERGFILRSSDVSSCTPENLYNFAAAGDWTPLLIAAPENTQWRNAPLPATPIPAATAPMPTAPAQQGNTPGNPPPQPPTGVITRPPQNGIFNAHNATGYVLDGNFAEWPNNWIPINSIILGQDRYSGPGDLSANFQVGWNESGLVMAIRVNDDIYSQGPAGSDLWRGDSIEIQFDRLLAEDFSGTLADADDYQIGVAFDENLTAARGYLWLPFEREAELLLPYGITISDQGYQLEVLVPWNVLEMGVPSPESTFGFNISINDNDSETNSQETVISASPARTTHNNPTEWGTLRILP